MASRLSIKWMAMQFLVKSPQSLHIEARQRLALAEGIAGSETIVTEDTKRHGVCNYSRLIDKTHVALKFRSRVNSFS